MLTQQEIEKLKNDGYTFEQIESIKKWILEAEQWDTIWEDEFWALVEDDINISFKDRKLCIK